LTDQSNDIEINHNGPSSKANSRLNWLTGLRIKYSMADNSSNY